MENFSRDLKQIQNELTALKTAHKVKTRFTTYKATIHVTNYSSILRITYGEGRQLIITQCYINKPASYGVVQMKNTPTNNVQSVFFSTLGNDFDVTVCSTRPIAKLELV